MDDGLQQVRKAVYQQHWDELIAEVRAWREDVAQQLSAVAPLLFAARLEPAAAPRMEDEIQVTSNKWRDYKTPKPVILAILREAGGSMKRKEIARLAVAGGWKNGGRSTYYDILDSIKYLATQAPRITLEILEDDTVRLKEG